MSKPYKAPKMKLEPRRVAEIPFQANLAAGAMVTLNSARITYPFRVVKVKMIFTPEAMNQVIHSWHVRTSPFVSATMAPVGDNLFERESPTATFIGAAIIRVVECNIEFSTGMRVISLYTNNTSPYAYDFNCSVVIEAM